ncbi:hypothetical protein BGZ83_004547 [Gryganskiella cystojenkinii]|nr:hypothetical protein BGZ83_004547 [Gryganskiella cystojenkinii]
MFDKQVFESPKTEALSSVYYSQHYQDLAKNYPELHYQVVLKARTSACEAQLASVTQWLGWEAAMGYPTLVAGEPPNCFCNRPMVLCTMRYSTFESSSSPSSLPTYYCEERLKTNTKGCTRFLAVKTTRPLRQLAQPYHAIVADLVQRIHEEPQAQIETATTDGVVSLSAVQSTRLEPNDRTLTRELVVIESDEDRDCDFDVGVASRDGEEQVQDLQLSSTSSSTSSDDNDDDLEAGLTSRLQKLTQQDQARIERQAAKMKAKEEYLKSQDAIEVWTGSRDRLQAQIESQEQLGLHNLELKCLACREGAIEYAVAPCYHMAMCSNCICSLKDCILCSVKIHGVQRVFWG